MALYDWFGGWASTLSEAFGIVHRQGRPQGKGADGPRIVKGLGVRSDDFLDNGYWAFGESTNVIGMRYDKKPKHLYVVFLSKGFAPARAYRYDGIERWLADQFFRAPSLGKFVHQVLIGGKFAKHKYGNINNISSSPFAD